MLNVSVTKWYFGTFPILLHPPLPFISPWIQTQFLIPCRYVYFDVIDSAQNTTFAYFIITKFLINT